MNTLAQHIEKLLLENDCVIVPGFGGFVAHYTSSVWCDEEESFLPPCRVIGFNPQLTINDGVLVQSYMAVYDVNFSDATRIIEQEVKELSQILQDEGRIELHNIGEISYSIDNFYTFKPYNNKLVSPLFYGLDSFQMTELRNLKKTITSETTVPVVEPKPSRHYEIRINRAWVRNGVAAAVAFILFFSLSTPLKNTYVAQENYAQLLPADLFKKIEKESLLTAIVGESKKAVPAEEASDVVLENKELDAAAPEVEIAEPVVAVTPPVVSDRTYHIIVASVLNQNDAEKIVEDWRAKGHQNAQVIARDGRIRVSIMSYADRAEGEQQLLQLRQNEMYKNTWLLPVR